MLPQWALELFRPVVRIICRICWQVRWMNVEQIPPHGGLIIASNHQTYLDPFWISCPIKRPTRYLAWDAAFSWPVVGWWLRMLGSWPLQLEGSDPKPIRRSIQWLREGGVVVIFPEGGRGTGRCGVPILPVTIRGGHRVWPVGVRFPRFAPVEVIYHPLFNVDQESAEESRALAKHETESLQAIIGGALNRDIGS